MTLTFTDVFCGAGGSSIGLTNAGLELKLAANHWARAIETHSDNFPNADHLCADVSNYDLRRLPRTDIGWFSPECTTHSPAGGRRRRSNQIEMFDDYVPSDALIRSRATMFDVIRATEVHHYKAVIVENVVEVAAWELFDWWLEGVKKIGAKEFGGYRCQIVCANSAHVGDETNMPAPQWRDRIYLMFTRMNVPKPNLELRPPAYCSTCDKVVASMQVWKRTDRPKIGKYGVQYTYRCPMIKCRHQVVEPFVLPAAAAIDWTDLGERIGDRKKALAPATMRRIEAGIEMFWQPLTVAVGGGTFERESSGYQRAWPALDAPLRARTATGGDGVATPPFMFHVNHDTARHFDPTGEPLAARTAKCGDAIVHAPERISAGDLERESFITMLRRNGGNVPAGDAPLATIAAEGLHHGVVSPPAGAFISKHHGGLDYKRIEHMNSSVNEPLGALVAKTNMSLVIPYRRGQAKPTSEPMHTIATRESMGLATAGERISVEDCRFRMLKPREHLRGQRFHDAYRVKGNQGEQVMQAGNAVSCNVAQWLGGQLVEALA